MRDELEIALAVEQVASALRKRGWMMAAAESCTGGWIAKACTDLAGSSEWFERGIVTYSNAAKRDLLEVCAKELEQEGAVSEVVALQMAKGALRGSGVQAAVAVTGIAGPGGGSPDKPVGTVWFGFAIEGQTTDAECCRFPGDRDSVRRQTVIHALEGLAERISAV